MQMLTDLFGLNATDEVMYRKWLTSYRSTLETITQSTEEFLDIFFKKLQILLSFSHSNTTIKFPKLTQVSPQHKWIYCSVRLH
jgi:hypothetical protein